MVKDMAWHQLPLFRAGQEIGKLPWIFQPCYGLMSAYNAKPNSWFTYMKCKGQIEEDLKGLDFVSLSIFKPGLLNRGDMYRWNERLFAWFSYAIPVSTVARAMRLAAGEGEECV